MRKLTVPGCRSKWGYVLLGLVLFGSTGCETYKVDEISIKSDSTGFLMGQPRRTFSVDIGNNFIVVTQMHEGKVATGTAMVDYDKTNRYKKAVERAIIGEMAARGFKYSADVPEIQIIYVLNFSGKFIGGYSKNWTISLGGFDRTYQLELFEVTGKFRSIPELNDELARELIAELLSGLAMTDQRIEP